MAGRAGSTGAGPRAGPAAAATVAVALAGALAYAGWWLSTPADCAVLTPAVGVWRVDGVRPELRGPCRGLRAGDLVTLVGADGYAVRRAGADLVVAEPLGPPRVGEAAAAGWSVLVFVLALAVLAGYAAVRRHRSGVSAVAALGLLAGCLLSSSLVTVLGLPAAALGTGWMWLFLAEVLVVYTLAWSGLLAFTLRFPEPPAPRAAVAAAYAGPLALLAAAAVLLPGPVGSPGWVGGMVVVQSAVTVGALGLAVAIAVRRFRRAHRDGVAGRQVRWVAAGGWTATSLVLAGWFVPALVTGAPLLPAAWLGLPGLALVLGLAVALLRLRLFDLDVVLRRTLVYSALTLALVVLYLLVVTGLAAVLAGPATGPVSVVGAVAVALAVNPLRLFLRRAVGRALYGDRDDPYAALGRLGRRLAVTSADVLPAAAADVAAALRVPFAAIDVLRDGAPVRVAGAGVEPADGLLWSEPLVHRGEVVGALLAAPREPGERPGHADRTLLADLAGQLAPAVRVLALDRDLQRSRERLVLAREEERRALRRALHDELGPTVAALALRAATARRLLAAGGTGTGSDTGGGTGDTARAGAELDRLRRDATAAAGSLRRLAYDLRPPALDELGLAGALREQAELLAPLDVDVDVTGAADPPARLPAAAEVAAYRIVVEAMTNAARHGGARCRVRVGRAGGELLVEVDDDGPGWPDGFRAGVGITSARERAGELGGHVVLGAAPGGGARLTGCLPLEDRP